MAAMHMPPSAVPFLSLLGVYVIYRVLDRVIRWPRVGRYSERYILVTGSGSGFGFRSCIQLDKLGCHVIAGCHSERGEKELKAKCSERLKIIRLDVSNPESVRQALQSVKALLPQGKGLWGLVNNAAVGGKRGRVEWMSVDDYRATNNINLYGLIDTTMTFLPLIKKEKGRIVNVTSMGGRIATPELAPYCVSKFGVEAFNDSLRRSLKQFGCHVALVEPSGYRTSMQSHDNIEKGVRDAWDEATPEAREEFGEEYLQQVLKACVGVVVKEHPDSVVEVTNCYEQALFSRHPRARYIPNRRAKNILAIIPNVPEWLSDWVLIRGMGRASTAVPAALKQQRDHAKKAL